MAPAVPYKRHVCLPPVRNGQRRRRPVLQFVRLRPAAGSLEHSPLEARKTVTVLFSDVKGSTALSERMDPERLRRVMTLYFDQARATLEWHGGKVEKFIGDAVMAVFGVPTVHEDDALRALRAAADLRQAIEELGDRLEHAHGTRIEIRIGVNSGEVIAGGPTRDSSFVSGEVVVVAERLQGSAAPGEILIGAETYRLARDAILAERLEPLVVKGKQEPVLAYRLLKVVPGAPALARRFDSPMVGRTEELALLESTFSCAVRERSCHLCTVLGPAGVGKSRLVTEALAGIGDRARVLSGSCLPYGEGITFWPVLQIVKQLTGIADSDSPAEAQEKIEQVLDGEPSRRDRRGAGCRADRAHGERRRRRRGVLGRTTPTRGAGATAASHRRLRRSQLG